MSIKQATLLLIIITLLSRATGLGREMLIAWEFGASSASDAFFVAYSIPFAFYSIVGVSLTAVMIPIIAEYEAKGDSQSGMQAASSSVNIVLIMSMLFMAVGVFFSHSIAKAMGSNFPQQTLDLAGELTALMMPTVVFMSVSGILGGVLNAHKIYAAPATGSLIMNMIAIASMIFARNFGIVAPVFGTVIGAFFYTIIHIPSLKKIGFRYSFKFSQEDRVIHKIFSSVSSIMMVSICYFCYSVIDFNLASGMPEGSITALNYATRFIQLPQGLFTLAVTTAIFPTLSAQAARGQYFQVQEILEKGIRIILLMAVPCSALLLLLGKPILVLLFQHGKFDAQATSDTTQALLYLTIGLVGFSLNLPLIRCFYALGNKLAPLIIAMISVMIKLMLSSYLSSILMERGLALATSVTYLVNSVIMVLVLRRRLSTLLGSKFAAFILKLILMTIGMLFVATVLGWVVSGDLIVQNGRGLLYLFLVGGGALGSFLMLGLALSIDEICGFVPKAFRRRMF